MLANVMCPPALHNVFPEELLLPYIRHAHNWITAALEGRLIAPDQRFEMPHLVECAEYPITVYAEGGTGPFEWICRGKGGVAYLRRIRESRVPDGELYRVSALVATVGTKTSPQLISTIREDAFGAEEEAGIALGLCGITYRGWSTPPAAVLEGFLPGVQRRILETVRLAGRADKRVSLLLLAFGIPKFWGGPKEAIVWTAIQLKGWEPGTLNPPSGFRRDHPEGWPESVHFIAEITPFAGSAHAVMFPQRRSE